MNSDRPADEATVNLSPDERLALIRLLRRAIDEDRYPMSPRPGTALRAEFLLDRQPARAATPPPLKANDAPRPRGRRR